MADLHSGPKRSNLRRQDVKHVANFTRGDMSFENLENGPCNALRIHLGMARERGGNVGQELL